MTPTQAGVFQAMGGAGPRIRILRPWTSTASQATGQVSGGEGVIATTAPTRLVQLMDGRMVLTTPTNAAQTQQPQAQQQTVIIANHGTVSLDLA